jgi:hypothetical protein
LDVLGQATRATSFSQEQESWAAGAESVCFSTVFPLPFAVGRGLTQRVLYEDKPPSGLESRQMRLLTHDSDITHNSEYSDLEVSESPRRCLTLSGGESSSLGEIGYGMRG